MDETLSTHVSRGPDVDLNQVDGVGLLPKDWHSIVFAEAVLRRRPKVAKIKRSEYKRVGRFPIVDQGQENIAGYWDETSDANIQELPVIVFGDHTRIFKYVDYPFVAGADGTQILLPNTKHFDPYYLFLAFSRLKITNRGYNRHFSLLRSLSFPCPSLDEQRTISNVFQRSGKGLGTRDFLA